MKRSFAKSQAILLACLLLISCSKPRVVPRLEFTGGFGITHPMASSALAGQDTAYVAPMTFIEDDSLSARFATLEMRLIGTKKKVPRRENHLWIVSFALQNGAPDTIRIRTLSPIQACERLGGFMDFSTGEPPLIQPLCNDTLVQPLRLLPDSQCVTFARRLLLQQPTSEFLAELELTSQVGRPRVTLRRQKRLKRRYDFAVELVLDRTLILPPGASRDVLSMRVGIVTGDPSATRKPIHN